MKWLLVAVAAWYLYRSNQLSVAEIPAAAAVQPNGAQDDGFPVYVFGIGGGAFPLNTGPTGPYGTLGPEPGVRLAIHF
jgi:hypothetical protein